MRRYFLLGVAFLFGVGTVHGAQDAEPSKPFNVESFEYESNQQLTEFENRLTRIEQGTVTPLVETMRRVLPVQR